MYGSRIGSHNGLAPPRRQAIIWTNEVVIIFTCRCPSDVLTEKLPFFQVLLGFQNIFVESNLMSLVTQKSSMEEAYGFFSRFSKEISKYWYFCISYFRNDGEIIVLVWRASCDS